MNFVNNLFTLKKISIKNISFFRSIIRIETFNNSFCDSLGNFIKRVIFLTTNSYKIIYLKIYKIKSEFYDLPGIIENTQTILKNLDNIIIKINNDNVANLIIKKKGPCIITAKDIFSDKNITIFNPNKIIANVSNNIVFYCIMKCVNSLFKNYTDEFFQFKIFKENIIFLNNFKSPIISLNYYINKKIFNKKLKKLFFDIETNGSIKPVDCFKNCIFYIKKYFDLIFSFIGFKKYKKINVEKKNNLNLKINSVYLNSINNLKLSIRSLNCLKNNNIFLIGDLIKISKNNLINIPNLGKKSYNEILNSLKNFGLNLNSKIEYDL
ncbi:RNA polymerase alpha subunit [Candidatus Carsonella ruddii PV]|uniref:DNA-directed RNA polymerase subunit alpha n=1 Tax=Carsonella ruddii (strain PV) TaxID=387662 RepID=RPOA_CARRP|nr:DNA-directed RNA polymerase subunit alpha C-terminal domain-containing protein [Candidatus Carsonella ruddii]Q05FK5.1 RecName: Full=DNA-directed RNA polymerase subunit alpha; Short=RNAP subunit alpha; AltName: Full=RNA polymerase subunit alpha; AltName: Full=Transcriptase subunit alpha [Candidatus Carsonella ruddii PV]BAF35166.1 RNA polymerase alpha subunit [Candidatus Carsonella ruddii PV]